MTERRRPLEDDGQGALFGGEAFAPAGPAPPWKRPAGKPSLASETAAAPSLHAGVDVDARTELEPSGQRRAAGAGADVIARDEFDPCADAAPQVAAGTGADVAVPSGSESRAEAGPTHALVQGAPAPTSPSPFADEVAALERATEGHSPRRPRAPLAGPTLDDVMSRVWEGLVTGLPAACPVCHGEVVPALTGPPHGRCSSCGTTID